MAMDAEPEFAGMTPDSDVMVEFDPELDFEEALEAALMSPITPDDGVPGHMGAPAQDEHQAHDGPPHVEEHEVHDGVPAGGEEVSAQVPSQAGEPHSPERPKKKFKKECLWEAFAEAQNPSPVQPGVDHPRVVPQKPLTFLEEMSKIMKYVQETYPGWSTTDMKLIAIVKFLCDANTSNYILSNAQRLGVILLVDGEHWRAHRHQVFHYQDGAWVMTPQISISTWEILTSVEGAFISLAEQGADFTWNWTSAKEYVDQVFTHGRSAGDATKFFCDLAKASSDHVRIATDNKVWKANWCRRVAEMVSGLRRLWDSEGLVTSLTKLFLIKCDTPLPKSIGIFFIDIYVNEDWEEAPKGPDNNCYFQVQYSFHVSSEYTAQPGFRLADWRKKLNTFLKALYFQNEGGFLLKLAFLKLAFLRVCSGRMIFEIGKGGDGKGMEAILEKHLLGPSNSATLDCACFIDRMEFRKSGEFAWNMCTVRIQEMDHHGRFVSDVWKRFVVDEEIACRVNFGFTSKRRFGSSMKVQELNYENIPVIEEAKDHSKACEQLRRRAVCIRMGKAKLTPKRADVDEASGVFMLVPQEELTTFLSHPIASAMYLKDWCIPFFKENSVEDCLRMVNDPGTVDPMIARDTDWLALRLSGGTGPPPGEHASSAAVSDLVVKLVHEKTPNKLIIKEYIINKVNGLQGACQSSKGKTSKMQNFIEAVDNSSLSLVRQMESGAFQKLQVDLKLMEQLMVKHGGSEVFGDWDLWGDVFQFRDAQTDLDGHQAADDLYEVIANHKHSRVLMEETASLSICEVVEQVHLGNLRRYASLQTDRRQSLLDSYIRRHELHGTQDGETSSIMVQYYQSPNYGRRLSRGPAGQKLTREARHFAFGDGCAEADAPNCHPRLLMNLLKKYDVYSVDEYPLLTKFTDHYQDWRQFLSDYTKEPVREAKTMMIKLFYGAQPAVDLPHIRKLSAEVYAAADALLSHPANSKWKHLFQDRRNPTFSRLAALLSFEENDMLQHFQTALTSQNSDVCVLIYDGALVSCTSLRDEAKLLYATEMCEEHCNAPMAVKSWPRNVMVQTLPHWLLRKLKVKISPSERAVTDMGTCLLNAVATVKPEFRTPDMTEVDGTGEVFIIHQDLGTADQVGHFYAVGFYDTGSVTIFDSAAGARVFKCALDDFCEAMACTLTMTWFSLSTATSNDQLPLSTDAYALLGAGDHSWTRQRGPIFTANLEEGAPKVKITTPLTECFKCGTCLTTEPSASIPAVIFGFDGAKPVEHVPKRCTDRACRMRHHYNYRWDGSKKLNTLTVDQCEYVFINAYVGFTKVYLAYHDTLQFRGFTSAKAITWTSNKELFTNTDLFRLDRHYTQARSLYVGMKEFGFMWGMSTVRADATMMIVDDPITAEAVAEYDIWWHRHVMGPRQKSKVKALAVDGEGKVAVKCASGEEPPPRAGRPFENKEKRRIGNGWFMASEPDTGLIIGICEMKNPENNATLFDLMKKILPGYRNVDLLLYDRMCKCVDEIQRTPALQNLLRQVKFKSVDKWHGWCHSDGCKCSPWNHERLWRRLGDVNSSVAEQVFSWFRNYTTTLNTMSPVTHRFYVLYYAKLHNVLMLNGDTDHLPPRPWNKNESGPVSYTCKTKVIKVMKRKADVKKKVQKNVKKAKVMTPKTSKKTQKKTKPVRKFKDCKKKLAEKVKSKTVKKLQTKAKPAMKKTMKTMKRAA
ncbi:unnamed protein product, partial [Polarella glacialis]